MQVHWIKCGRGAGVWCDFANLNLASLDNTDVGVYIIWRAADGRVVYVGQGDVAARIREHRLDPSIYTFAPLNVTWASIEPTHRHGVERYLADRLQPLVGVTYPNVLPIYVNTPSALVVFG